jgi:hypothetical protein
MPNGPRKRQDGKQEVEMIEIEELRQGQPKVREYWDMVKQEMEQLLTKLENT